MNAISDAWDRLSNIQLFKLVLSVSAEWDVCSRKTVILRSTTFHSLFAVVVVT